MAGPAPKPEEVPKEQAPHLPDTSLLNREVAYLASLRSQLTQAAGDTSEYSKVLNALTNGPQKEFDQGTKTAALSMAKQIDILKEATRANEEYAKVLAKVEEAERTAQKSVDEFTLKQEQSIDAIKAKTAELGMSPADAARAAAFAKIDKDTQTEVLRITETLGKIGDTEGIDRQVGALQRLSEQLKRDTGDALDQAKAKQDALNDSWDHGAETALRNYQDNVATTAKGVESMMTGAFKNMEDALVNFVKTGKISFTNLANSIITDLIRIQIQNAVTKPLAAAMSSGGMSGLFASMGSGISDFFGGFMATGGPVLPGQYYVVGENGPELLVPNAAGTIIPNGGGASSSAGDSSSGPPVNINFNVQAMDAQSFRSAMASNKATIVGIVRQAFTKRAVASPI